MHTYKRLHGRVPKLPLDAQFTKVAQTQRGNYYYHWFSSELLRHNIGSIAQRLACHSRKLLQSYGTLFLQWNRSGTDTNICRPIVKSWCQPHVDVKHLFIVRIHPWHMSSPGWWSPLSSSSLSLFVHSVISTQTSELHKTDTKTRCLWPGNCAQWYVYVTLLPQIHTLACTSNQTL